jgi:hypothetical protein
MGMIAICSPNQIFAQIRSRQRSSKGGLEQPEFIACHIFASGGLRLSKSAGRKANVMLNRFGLETHQKSSGLEEYSSFKRSA